VNIEIKRMLKLKMCKAAQIGRHVMAFGKAETPVILVGLGNETDNKFTSQTCVNTIRFENLFHGVKKSFKYLFRLSHLITAISSSEELNHQPFH